MASSSVPQQSSRTTEPAGSMPRPLPSEQETIIGLPLALCKNYESLNHPQVRRICALNREIQKRCIMCEKPAKPSFACKTCRAAGYCSWGCNVDDRPHHALVCRQWLAMAPSRPSQAAKLMLLFPAQSATPVLTWAETHHDTERDCLCVWYGHREIRPFLTRALRCAPKRTQCARLGCINACRALAGRKAPLGHGLFLLEWALDANRDGLGNPAVPDLGVEWINQSVLASASATPSDPTPGRVWAWTGPIAVLALDLTVPNKPALDDVTLRDVRHAVDFFSLSLRNPCVPPAPSSIACSSPSTARLAPIAPTTRFPFPTLPAVKLNEPRSPIALAQGIIQPLEEVHVTRYLPAQWAREMQGVSVLCVDLGLPWVVRNVLRHGEELDWLYNGFVDSGRGCSDLPSSGGNEASGGSHDSDHDNSGGGCGSPGGGGSGTGQIANEEGSAIPPWLHLVYVCSGDRLRIETRKMPQTGDGLVVMHGAGGRIRKEHLQALLAYVDRPDGMAETGRLEISRDGFRAFWERSRAVQGVDDVPSPYELTPKQDANRDEHGGIVVCQSEFALLRSKLSQHETVR